MKAITMKRTAAIGAAAVMTLAAAVPTIGSVNPFTKTAISASAEATYALKAYKIFATTNNSDFTWADGITAAGQEAAYTALGLTTTGDKTVAKIIEKLTDATSGAANAELFAKAVANNTTGEGITVTNNTFTAPEMGYYVVTGTKSENGYSAKTLGMLIQAKENNEKLTLGTPKVDLPTIEKKVYEDDGREWQDVADAESQQVVKFRLCATLPSNYDKYDSYFLNFKDTLDQPGFDEDNSFKNVKVYLKEGSDTPAEQNGVTLTESGITTTATSISKSFEIKNVKNAIPTAEAGDTIIIEYEAKLTADAIVKPTTGNDNAVTVEYPNNPNHKYENEGSGDTDEKGESPKDEVRVLTYGIKPSKTGLVTAEDKVSAKFVLEKKVGENWVGAVLDEDNDPADEEAYQITGWIRENFTEITASDLATRIKGLDRGETYRIRETTVPSGYVQTPAILEFTLNAELTTTVATFDTNTNPLESLSATVNPAGSVSVNTSTPATGDKSTGFIEQGLEMVNKKTSDLPTTGGMGTKIFFGTGGLLTVGGAIYLISKKRMQNK